MPEAYLLQPSSSRTLNFICFLQCFGMKELTRITKTSLKDDCFKPFSLPHLRSSLRLSVPLFVLQRLRSSERYAKRHLLICDNKVLTKILTWHKIFHCSLAICVGCRMSNVTKSSFDLIGNMAETIFNFTNQSVPIMLPVKVT